MAGVTVPRRFRPLFEAPLHGTLPKDQQLKAFFTPAKGNRKVVVATNLAEASASRPLSLSKLRSAPEVTIEGIVYVVDSCLVKLEAFCPYNGTSYLNIAACSQGSARQRAGRAGRTRPGHCFRWGFQLHPIGVGWVQVAHGGGVPQGESGCEEVA